MADPLKTRISILQMGEAKGRLKPEHQAELDGYRAQGLVKGAGAAEKQQNSIAAMRADAEQLKRDLANARTKLDATAGRVGRVLGSSIPLTPAYDFEQALVPVRSNVALSKLAELKANSPSGASGFGALSEKELDLLTGAMGSLDSKQSAEQLRRSFDTIESVADRILANNPAPESAPAPTQAAPAPQTQTATATVARMGSGNPIADAVESAAGQTTPERMAEFEQKLRAAYDGGANKDALEAIAAEYNLSLSGVDDAIAAREKGDRRLVVSAAPPPSSSPPDGRGTGGVMEKLDASVRGVADTLTLGLADEIAALGSTILDPRSTLRDNLDRERATDRFDEGNHFGARLAGQLVGGAALPMGAARTPAALGKVGAGYGAAYGFGSGEGFGDRLGQAALGGATGGALGYGAGRVGQAVAARRARGGTDSGGGGDPGRLARERAQLTGEAAERLGIDMMPADVGGPMVRRLTSAATQAPVSAVPITRAAERTTQQALGARDRIAATLGEAVDPELAGEAAKSGAQSFIRRTSSRSGDLYANAERLAGLARVIPVQALEVLERNISELSQVPGGADGLAVMQNLADEIRKMGTISVAGVRGMRTSLRDRFLANGLRGSDLERRINQVVDAASRDLVNSLNEGGRGAAARAYAVADRYWRSRLSTIDDVLEPIIGKQGEKSGEQVLQAIQSASRGNARRLSRFIRALPPGEKGIVRATIVSQLGRSTAGAQDAAGVAFSLPQFLTHWNQMTPGAKRVLFNDAARAALDDLARVAEGAKQASRYANTSNTAGGVIGQAVIAGSLGAVFDFGTMGAALASQYGAGKLLASPRFARWLARAPKQRDPLAHIEKLRDIAAKEAAIAPEILGFQRNLIDALQYRAASVAAAEEDDEKRPVMPKRE